MFNRIATIAAAALLWTSTVNAAVRIDFADDSAVQTPGFNVGPAAMMSTMSDHLRIGSNVPGQADGVDFLRITSSNSSTLGSDVLGFIVTMPYFTLDNGLGNADGIGVDRYRASFSSGGTFAPNGFVIYSNSDTGLTTPLLIADMTLLDQTLFLFGGSGSLESSVGLNLTNIQLLPLGNAFATLREFQMTGGAGASFVAGISSAGSQGISSKILARANIDGSSSGSVESVIPEPATLILLAVGALAAKKRKVL